MEDKTNGQNDGLNPEHLPENNVEQDVATALDDDAEAARIAVAAVDELAQKDTEIARLQDMLTRQVADFQNYRRRMEAERTRFRQEGREEVVRALLDVFDDLGRSLHAAHQVAEQGEAHPGFEALRSGVEMIHGNFAKALQRLEVVAIEAVGQPFDEQVHEALMQQPAPEDMASGTVMAELQSGYKMGDRVLRHSKVIVAA